ncbi:hypothetical protein Tco_1026967 [Tanacetum coccineum]
MFLSTLNIDGQSMDFDAPPYIIDVDEDNDSIDDEDMSAAITRGHGSDGGGDDRPPSRPIGIGCQGSRDPDLLQTSSRQIGIYKSTIGLILRTMPEAFKMLKTGQRARSSASRDPGHLLSSEICK